MVLSFVYSNPLCDSSQKFKSIRDKKESCMYVDKTPNPAYLASGGDLCLGFSHVALRWLIIDSILVD